MATESIQPTSIVEETRRRYLTYALSVISSRALPDVRDGLKPVQRRILYCMQHSLSLSFDRRHVKCARITGDVSGKFHPHGTVPIYDALVRLAQDFVMRVPLVDIHGNAGTVDGDPPAAERYTEGKLAAAADHLMAELRQKTVPMRPTYDGQTEEPVVLPAQFPNMLVNGASGIAVGMATNMPPHNLGETLRACVHLIENPDATVAQLLDKIKGPDFPLGGKLITDRTTLRKIYEEGQGSIKVQAEWKVEEGAKGKRQIVVTSIPYAVNKGTLEAEIGEIIASRKLPQLLDLTNESNEKVGLRLTLDIKPDADAGLVMAYLFKHTKLQDNFAYNMTCLVPDDEGNPQPRRLGLGEILRYFLDFRFDTVKRRFEYELEVLRRRIHILKGFKIIFNALDKAIKLIRESNGKSDAAEKLMKHFELDEIQTDAILDSQLYRIAQLEIKKILDELREKEAEAARIEAILKSEKKLWGVVKDELGELAEKYKDDRRRTRISAGDDMPEFDEAAYIVKENTNVVLTRDGWVKRVGRLASVEGTRVREGDSVTAVLPASTLDPVVFFADDGSAYTCRAIDIPASSGYGEPITKFFKLGDNVRIVGAATADERFIPAEVKGKKDEPPGPYLLVITQQGMAVRTPFAPFRVESTRVGRRYIRLNDGDKVVMTHVLLGKEKSMFLVSANAHVLFFPIDEINVIAGVGKGVIGIKLDDDDTCLGGQVIDEKHDRIRVETSSGKDMEFTNRHEATSRGGKGFEAVKRASFVRILPSDIELVNWDEIEGKTDGKASDSKGGKQKGLFDE